MAYSMKIVSNKASASAVTVARRAGLAKRTAAVSSRSNQVAGLRRLNKVGYGLAGSLGRARAGPLVRWGGRRLGSPSAESRELPPRSPGNFENFEIIG